MSKPVFVYKGEELASYGFGADHPFGDDRHDAFHAALSGIPAMAAVQLQSPSIATREQLALFHSAAYIDKVERLSASGRGYLDAGDTPVVPGVFEAASAVVGTTLHAVDAVMRGDARHAFVPIAGLHHASREAASGFCVFNDCGVAIEHLKGAHNLRTVLYVDIDAHHGDGVYYAFADDPAVVFADLHEDGRYLYPGTGAANEVGRAEGEHLKLNIPLPPGAGDNEFFDAWPAVETLIERHPPEFVLLQCGADSVAGDPLTHLEYSPQVHGRTALRLCELADRYCDGRLVAMGGGGYNRANLAAAWTEVVEALAR